MYEGQRVVAVVDAVGKRGHQALWPLGERPLLWHVITRLKATPSVDEIVVIVDEQDQNLQDLITWMALSGLHVFRSSSGDLLERTYQALLTRPPQVVVPLGVDRPLFSPEHLEVMISYLIDAGFDAVDAAPHKTGMTSGLDTRVLRYQALVDAHLLALDPRMRQETERFIMERPQAFRTTYLKPPEYLCSSVRLLVEDEVDYEQMRRIYRALYRAGEIVDCQQVVEWLGRRAVA